MCFKTCVFWNLKSFPLGMLFRSGGTPQLRGVHLEAEGHCAIDVFDTYLWQGERQTCTKPGGIFRGKVVEVAGLMGTSNLIWKERWGKVVHMCDSLWFMIVLLAFSRLLLVSGHLNLQFLAIREQDCSSLGHSWSRHLEGLRKSGFNRGLIWKKTWNQWYSKGLSI